MQSYKELTVWQKSCELVVAIYRLTTKLPTTEQFGLKSQMQRAAVSIPSNIAEGFNRRTVADNRNFIRIAFASGAELETQLYLIIKLDLVHEEDTKPAQELLQEVLKMLNVMGQRLTSG